MCFASTDSDGVITSRQHRQLSLCCEWLFFSTVDRDDGAVDKLMHGEESYAHESCIVFSFGTCALSVMAATFFKTSLREMHASWYLVCQHLFAARMYLNTYSLKDKILKSTS